MVVIIAVGIVLLYILVNIYNVYLTEKDDEKRKEENAINNVEKEFESITNCLIFDKNIISNLETYLSYLEKLKRDENIVEYIRPYDEYHVGKIKKHLGYASIIIDGNGEPRLSPKCIDLSASNEYRDYEISACLNKEQLEDFIKQCKKIKINHDIETFRKNKIEEGLKK